MPNVGGTFWDEEEAERFIGALERIAQAHERFAADVNRWVLAMTAESALNQELLQLQLELTRKSLELINQPQPAPRTALPEPESTAGGQIPAVRQT